MANLGVGEVLQAEAWGLFHGLEVALQHGASKILCESDSTVLVSLILDSDVEVHPLGAIVRNCRNLMKLFSSCSLRHVHRERNNVADCLAKASLSLERGLFVLEAMPICVAEAIEEDARGVARMRRVPDQFVQDCGMLAPEVWCQSVAGGARFAADETLLCREDGMLFSAGAGSGEVLHMQHATTDGVVLCRKSGASLCNLPAAAMQTIEVCAAVGQQLSSNRHMLSVYGDVDGAVMPRQEGVRLPNLYVLPEQDGATFADDGSWLGNEGHKMKATVMHADLARQSQHNTSC